MTVTDFGYGALSNSQIGMLLGLEKEAMDSGYSSDMMKKIMGNKDLYNAFTARNNLYTAKNGDGDKGIRFYISGLEMKMLYNLKKNILYDVLYGEGNQDIDPVTNNIRYNMRGIRSFIQNHGISSSPSKFNLTALTGQLRDIYQSRIAVGKGANIALITGMDGIQAFNEAVKTDVNATANYRIMDTAFMKENNNKTVANVRNYMYGLVFNGYQTTFGANIFVMQEPLFDDPTFTNNRKASSDMLAIPIDDPTITGKTPLSGVEIKMGGENTNGFSIHNIPGTVLERGSGQASQLAAYDTFAVTGRGSFVFDDPTNGLWISGENINV